VHSGEVSAQELVEGALSRLEEHEWRIGTFCFVDAERALAEAERISSDDPRPFAGVPIAIKDGTLQDGLPMRIGSALFKGYVADYDGASIKRFREAGLVPIGRTTMPEFGILPTTEPRLTGPTATPGTSRERPVGPRAAPLRRLLRVMFL
jgi:amidase